MSWTTSISACQICDKDRDPFEIPDEPCGHGYKQARLDFMVRIGPTSSTCPLFYDAVVASFAPARIAEAIVSTAKDAGC